jgi:hypothetical protein
MLRMSFMMVVEGNQLILERFKMGIMYFLCVSRLDLDVSCCFVVAMDELREGLTAKEEPFMLLVFSGYYDMFYTLKVMIPGELFGEASD